ncbi:tumor protein D53 isoform X2 [Pseudoliparis swirei]|uniref:tumor protein D53 isoform X2 n=1 Tax=Pseudoliparis swirei TaxID=2059687 RepID=UPI0024BE14F2|nr:tumor protein D53 isoform X2 [Pseudoliparis swirei]
METRQQELYSGVLSDAVVDWGSVGPGEEWVNSAKHEGEEGLNPAAFYPSEEESVKRRSHGDDSAPVGPNGGKLTEGSKTSPSGGDEWARTSMSRSDDWAMFTSWDMQLDSTEGGRLTAGFLDSEPLREADEDMASEVHLNSSLTEEEREEIQQELDKLEEEISTLRQVLTSKEKQHAELKQKLGVTSLNELRNNFSRGWHDVQTSTAYKKTSETLSTAGLKTSAAFSTLGSAITRRFGDMRYTATSHIHQPPDIICVHHPCVLSIPVETLPASSLLRKKSRLRCPPSRRRLAGRKQEAALKKSSPPRLTPALRTRPPTT